MSMDKAKTRKNQRSRNPLVFFDISIADRHAGRLIIELRADIVPETCEHFRLLCTGEKNSQHGEDEKDFMYKGCPFHRIVSDYIAQCGDIENQDGSSGVSIMREDGKPFVDENFILKHTGPGILAMCNSGPDSNTSQFFITFVETEWLNDKHVVFGYLVGEDSIRTLKKVEEMGTESGRPRRSVVIAECGQLYP